MIRKYTPRDYPLISKWYDDRGYTAPIEACLSDMGWVVDEKVAGWLYITNSNIALIEGVISDPNTLPSARRASLQLLASHMVDKANHLGYTHVIAITQHPSIERICDRMGFRCDPALKVYSLEEEE